MVLTIAEFAAVRDLMHNRRMVGATSLQILHTLLIEFF